MAAHLFLEENYLLIQTLHWCIVHGHQASNFTGISQVSVKSVSTGRFLMSQQGDIEYAPFPKDNNLVNKKKGENKAQWYFKNAINRCRWAANFI